MLGGRNFRDRGCVEEEGPGVRVRYLEWISRYKGVECDLPGTRSEYCLVVFVRVKPDFECSQ